MFKTFCMMKIIYVIETLSAIGGIQKIIVEKANYMAERFGYQVCIISCTQPLTQSNAFQLSKEVKQINLGIPLYSQYRYKYPMRLFVKLHCFFILKKALNNCIKEFNPDILICMGGFMANIVCNIKHKAKKIVECHEAKYYIKYRPNNSQNHISRFFMKLNRHCYIKTIERNADAIITLTEGDKLLWNKAKRIEVIPNFSTMKITKTSSCDSKRVIAVGRLSWVKGHERLMDIWSLIMKKHPEWKLDIYGEGELENQLKKIIIQKRLKNISIHPFSDNISHEYSKSSICVMTSYFEGFPLVLLEALKHGVPCIAFDCPFGPSGIIADKKCGFLIEDGNNSLFAEKLCLLMEDESLRMKFSEACIKHARVFDTDKIMKLWQDLIKSLIIKNDNICDQ